MSDREMTAAEASWWRSFKKLIRLMPASVELNARVDGEIGIAPEGSRARNFETHHNADHFSEDEWSAVRVPRLDGRDSHL